MFDYLYIKKNGSITDKPNNNKLFMAKLEKINKISLDVALVNIKLYSFEYSDIMLRDKSFDEKINILNEIQYLAIAHYKLNNRNYFCPISSYEIDKINNFKPKSISIYKIVNTNYKNPSYDKIIEKKKTNRQKRDEIEKKCDMIIKCNSKYILLDEKWLKNKLNIMLKSKDLMTISNNCYIIMGNKNEKKS